MNTAARRQGLTGPGWLRLSSGFVQQMLAGHSALGLALGGLIYLVCVTGTLDVFVAELRAWEQPHPTVHVTQSFLDTALAQGQRRTEPGGYLYLLLPRMEAGRARLETGGPREMSYAVGADGRIDSELKTPFTDFIDRTHMYLCLPQRGGLVVVGLIGAALLSLLLSGVLAHPRIFRDAFTLRWGGSKRLQQADLHNRLSVWGLPFHLAVTLTGAFFGLSSVLAWMIAAAAYHGDTGRVAALLDGPGVAPDSRLAPLPAIAPMLARLGIAEHLDRLNYIGIANVGTRGALISFEVRVPGRLMRGERQLFDASGRYLGPAGYADGPAGKQVYAAAASLHFGSFGGLPVRLIYGVLGLALCVMSASGVSIWAARRRDQGRPAPRTERLWLGTIWGIPVALTASAVVALASALPPLPAFCAVLLAMHAAALTRSSAQDASYLGRLALAIGLATVAVVHLLEFVRVVSVNGLVIDGVCLLTAVVLALGIRNIGRT